MGLNLSAMSFEDWLHSATEGPYSSRARKAIIDALGTAIPNIDTTGGEGFPRVGSYTSYSVFLHFLDYISNGHAQAAIDREEAQNSGKNEESEDEDAEVYWDEFDEKVWQALNEEFGNVAAAQVCHASQFLSASDCESAFIPLFFEAPKNVEGIVICSLPAALLCLEDLAQKADYNLDAPFEEEYVGGNEVEHWVPLATARNISRIIYRYMKANGKLVVKYS